MKKKLLVLFTAAFAALFLSACGLDSTKTDATTATTREDGTTSAFTTDEVDPLYAALFDNANYHKIVLSFSRENFDKLIDDMQNYYDEFGSYRDNTIQEVDLRYEDGDGNVIDEYEVGFRTRGNIFTRRLPVVLDDDGNVVGYQQVSFQLEFNDTFDYPVNSTEYKALKERRLFDLEQLNFKYVRADDTSIVTEIAAYELYRAAGLAAPDTALCVVYFDIDGTIVPYGLFTMVEPVDDVFVRRYFGKNQDGSIGDLWKCVWQNGGPATLQPLSRYDYDGINTDRLGVSDYNAGYRMDYQLKTNKDTSDFSSLLTFMDRLNDDDVVNYRNVLESSLDVDSWLKTLAVGFLVGNPDDYRYDANNYYLYFYEGKAVYVSYDNDQCLGFGWNPFGDFTVDNDIYHEETAQTWFSYDDLPLVANVLAIDDYRTAYEDYLDAFTDPDTGLFDYADFRAEFLFARDLYQSEITTGFHLGVSVFSLSQRFMSAQDYYNQKTAAVRASVAYWRDR